VARGTSYAHQGEKEEDQGLVPLYLIRGGKFATKPRKAVLKGRQRPKDKTPLVQQRRLLWRAKDRQRRSKKDPSLGKGTSGAIKHSSKTAQIQKTGGKAPESTQKKSKNKTRRRSKRFPRRKAKGRRRGRGTKKGKQQGTLPHQSNKNRKRGREKARAAHWHLLTCRKMTRTRRANTVTSLGKKRGGLPGHSINVYLLVQNTPVAKPDQG